MDSNLIPAKTSKTSTFLSWILIASAIFSCSSRADYNVILGFLILLLRSHRTDRFKYFCKATIHILILSLVFDCIWIWQYTSYWKHGEETSELWKSLSFAHNSAYYLGILEFLIKLPIVLFLYKQFINIGGQIKELFNFNYSAKL